MIPTARLQTFLDEGGTVVDQNGDKVGKVGQVYVDDHTNEPSWVTAKTGLFGTSETFVPLEGASLDDDQNLRVPFAKDHIKDAPRLDADGHLTPREEEDLYRYYGQAYAGPGTRDSGPGDHDASVVRSEEQVDVDTQTREAGKARLRKYVVTDHVTTTVPVQREEVRVEREPVDGPATGRDLGSDDAEVTLHEEEVVVDKQAKPVERVSLDTETVTEQRTVEQDVRKEQVDVDTDETRR